MKLRVEGDEEKTIQNIVLKFEVNIEIVRIFDSRFHHFSFERLFTYIWSGSKCQKIISYVLVWFGFFSKFVTYAYT